MLNTTFIFSRRYFLKSSIAMTGIVAMPFGYTGNQTLPSSSVSEAKYTRYNVMSEGGKKALRSYAKGIEAMLNLSADHPQNWFRNAFIHLMDCPHGNWWFYVWHRGYLGYFEQTIRNLSGDDTFAMPYWDWTTLPQIPDSMFDDLLTPRSKSFEAYTSNFAIFTSKFKPALIKYWSSLNTDQLTQLKIRGYTGFDDLWNDVTGYSTQLKNGIAGNMAYATTCSSRYLTRDNPSLDGKTMYDVSPSVILSGLLPKDFYNSSNQLSFTSGKTPSHNTQPSNTTKFSVLEGLPHNKVHNYIGGVGPLDPTPYGSMTNFLSPVDPIFFLHHSNIDRLWDIWTRKQKSLNLPYLPSNGDLQQLSEEPFLFYVDGRGNYVGESNAGQYLDMAKFEYEYEPGFGEEIISHSVSQTSDTNGSSIPLIRASIKENVAELVIPTAAINSHLANSQVPSLMIEVTVQRSNDSIFSREFDVILGAPPNLNHVDANSPYYAGTIAFFGSMSHMARMPQEASFVVPLPKSPEAFNSLEATESTRINIRVVPTNREGSTPIVKGVTLFAY